MSLTWQTKKIGEVTKICLGLTHTPKYVENGIPFLSVKDISQGYIDFNHTRFITENEFKSMPEGSKPKKGDVLFCRVGTIGYPQIVDKDKEFGIFVSLGFFRVNEEILLNKYIAYWMMSPLFDLQVKKNVQGSTLKNLNTGWLKDFNILLPSISEQQRIVKILDKTFESIAEAKTNAEKNLQNSKIVFGTYLRDIFNGKGVDWDKPMLGDLCELVTKGTTPTSIGYKFVEEGVNFIKIESIDNNRKFLKKKFAYITNECHMALKRSQLKKNDILFSIAGALGRTTLVSEEILPANTNQALAIIRLKSQDFVLPEFLLYALESGLILDQIGKFKGGVAQQNLSLEQVKRFQINLPPLSEQILLVKKFSSLSEEVKRLEKNYQQKLADLEELKKSILSKAFNGDL